MAAIAVPVEMSPHPFTFTDVDLALIEQALGAAEAAIAEDKLLPVDRALIADSLQRWQEQPETATVDGWQMLSLSAMLQATGEGEPVIEAFENRWLVARDAHLDEQPHAVRSLRYLMSDITEELLQASWTDSTPYLCWRLAEQDDAEVSRLRQSVIAQLRVLREQADGWWLWPSFDVPQWQAPAAVFVPLGEWRAHLDKDHSGRIEDQLRWALEAFPDASPPAADEILY